MRQARTPPVLRPALLAAVTLLLGACANLPAPISAARIAEIVASPDRSAPDRTNDLRRKQIGRAHV